MMGSKEQAQKNVRDVTSAWEAFRSLFHSVFPGSGRSIDQATRLANKKRRYG